MGGPCNTLNDCTSEARSCYFGQCSNNPPVAQVPDVPVAQPFIDTLAPPVAPLSQQELLNALLAQTALNQNTGQEPNININEPGSSSTSLPVTQEADQGNNQRPCCILKPSLSTAPVTATPAPSAPMPSNQDYITKDFPVDNLSGATPTQHTSVVFGAKTLYRPIKPIASLGKVTPNAPAETAVQYRSTTQDRVDLVALDVVCHRGDIVQLLTDRSIQTTNTRGLGKRYVSEFSLCQMVSLGNNGVLGLGTDGNVYQQTSSVQGSLWRWALADWAPKNIVMMNTTHNNDYLWLQSSSTGWLYHVIQDPDQYRDPVLVEKVPMTNGVTRSYGNAKSEYIEYNPVTGQGTVMPGKQKVTGAYRALVKPDGQAITAPPSVRRLRWVNGVVYYIMDR